MSTNQKLDKEQSIILDNNDNNNNNNINNDINNNINNNDINNSNINNNNINNNINNSINDNNIDNSNSNDNILKTEIIRKEIKYTSPIEKSPEFNLNLNGELKVKSPREEKTAVCWNCQGLLMVKDGWDIVECSECHKLNRIPKDNFPIDQRITVAKSYGNLNQNEPLIYGIAICPLCQTENKFQKNQNYISCYKCGYDINLNNNKLFNNNFENNFINRSYDFSSPREFINYSPYNPLLPNVIQLRGMIPFPPMVPCYGNCSECTLLKILKYLKRRPKETYVPYPMYPYYRQEEPPKRDVKYIPINTESKKIEPEDEGYKIVIRKKPKGRDLAQSSDKINLSKNKVFEKVFFTK